MFDRQALTLGEELEAARRYLEVMQARLGARLRFEIEADPATWAPPAEDLRPTITSKEQNQ